MQKIAVMGDLSAVLAFRGLGMTVVATNDGKEALHNLDRLVDQGYGIIYVTEPLALAEPQLLTKYREEITPAVIVIPGSSGFADLGMTTLREQVKRAVGMDLLKDREDN